MVPFFMNFRKDINGLRAIAVISVLVFHFFELYLPSGFIGVDIFFVISGYLMAGIIFKGLSRGEFNLLDFYSSRALRIVPPLFFLCLAVFIFSWFYLAPWDFKSVGRDIATSLTFLSNVIYSMKGGYFGNESSFLLHTWSLSVEWQFYLIFPILLILLSRFSEQLLKWTVLFITFFLFTFSIFYTEKNISSSYYLIQTRGWEMMIGSLAFLFPINQRTKFISLIKYFGLLILMLSFIYIDSSKVWPSFYTLLPVFGAYLILATPSMKGFLLDAKVFQMLGTPSYSIYLWHWPIVIAISYFSLDYNAKVFGFISALLSGYLAYYFIELRLNYFKKFGAKFILPGIATMVLLGFTSGLYIYKTQGAAYRYPLENNSLLQGGTSNEFVIKEGVSYINSNDKTYDYLVIGDSNSNHYYRGIINSKTKVKMSWYSACLSFPTLSSTNSNFITNDLWSENCKNNYKQAINETKGVLIAHDWLKGVKALINCNNAECDKIDDLKHFLDIHLNELLTDFPKSTDIYLVGDLAKPKYRKTQKCLKGNTLLKIERHCETRQDYPISIRDINSIINTISAQYPNVTFIDPSEAYCNGDMCDFSLKGESIFFDGSHLSGLGSELVWNHILMKVRLHEESRSL